MLKSAQELKRLLELLDRRIDEPLEIYLIGGANLAAQELLDRETMDIDVIIPPEFPPKVQAAIREIAVEEELPPKWINTMPSRDARFLSPGWEERYSDFYEGKNLRVFLLGRKDMIGLKIAAAFDRKKEDVRDLFAMNPTEEEWEFGRKWAREYDASPDWPKLIDAFVEKLKRGERE
jgi:hypothetical protein